MEKARRARRRRALVVEGGGMRGVFGAGVLDAFLEVGFDPFDLYIGASAGACNLASHLAGQHRRSHRVYTRYMVRTEFFNPTRFLRGGHWMDLDWLWEALKREDPLDVEAAVRNRSKEFRVVVTSARTGLPLYVRPGAEELNDCLKASCAIPVMYRTFPTIRSIPVTDGGVSDSVPVREAYRRGATDITVIRSRPADHVQRTRIVETLFSMLLADYPELWKAVLARPAAYMRAVGFITDPPNGVRITQIAPPGPLRSGRTTRDLESLNDDYELGRRMGDAAIKQWNACETGGLS